MPTVSEAEHVNACNGGVSTRLEPPVRLPAGHVEDTIVYVGLSAYVWNTGIVSDGTCERFVKPVIPTATAMAGFVIGIGPAESCFPVELVVAAVRVNAVPVQPLCGVAPGQLCMGIVVAKVVIEYAWPQPPP